MTEIAKYNGMMSYLTRPPVPKTQVADLVDDLEPGSLKDELKEKFDPSQETYEEYLQRKGLGERPFNASEGGSPLVPKPKPYTLDQFKQKADLYIKGALGGFDRGEMVDLLQKQLDKVEESESINKQEALQFIQERTQQLREFIKENPGETLPGLDRVNKAIGGLSYGRENFEYGGIKLAMEELIQEGNTTFLNRQKLIDAIEAKTGKRPGGSFQPSQADYKELFKKFTFLAPNIRAKQGDPEDYKLNKKQLKSLTKKVEALNKKYKLGEGKGIKLAIESTQAQGNPSLRLQTNTNVYGDLFTELEISPKKSAVPNDAGLKDLEKIIKKVTKSKVFKNYDKSAAMKAGGVKSAITQLRNAGSKQDLIFDYVLNSEQTPTIEELSKKFKMNKDLIKKDIKKLYVNMYRRAADEGGVFLPKDNKQLSNVMEKITDMDVDVTKDSVLNLITDAYGDSEEGNALRKKVRSFYKLQKQIPEKYQKFFSSQLDHIVPLNFLTQIRSDIPATDLIRIKPLPGFLNTRAFKAQLDDAIGVAKRTNDKEALEAYSQLRTFLPEILGGISKTGKITDFGAETLTEDKSLSKAQQTQTKKIYDSVLKFIDNPKAKPLLEKLGINQQTAFDALRGSGQLIRKNIPGFLNTFRRILKENPDLRVELGDPYKEIENQYASLLTMSDASPTKEQEKDSLPYEAALPAGVAAGKYGPQVLNLLKNVGKAVVRPVIAPLGGVSFAASELASDDPSQALAGLELLYPEIMRQVSSKATPIKNIYNRALALTPSLKYAPQVSKGLSGIGATMIGADILQGLAKRIGPDQRGPLTEQELLDMREREIYMGVIADAFDKAYREGTSLPGRTNFADGPEDPSKRNFMKIMGGLASLPILGRFFKIGEKAAPIIDAVKTEAAKGKPEWFDALVNKVIRMGEDVTDRFATVDRETVNQIDIADGETIRVYRNVDEGTVRVEYESPDNMGEGSVDLVYKKPLPDEGDPSPSANFYATELEPRGIRSGPDDYDIEFDGENYAENVDELMSDTTKLKEFATDKKRTIKELIESKKKTDKTKAMNESTLEQAEYLETKYGPGPEPDDY